VTIRRFKEDKAYLFLQYWRMVAPGQVLPIPEYYFDLALGRKHRFDWAFPEYRIGVEIDGGGWAPHGGRHAGDGDREKLNIAASLRWLVFRFSPVMINRKPTECINMVLNAIKDSQ
jgi:very-short-patch-repair endonuclease